MLERQEYLKTVRRNYPPLFVSLIFRGYANEEHFRAFMKKPFSIREMIVADNVWYYSKEEVSIGSKLIFESWQDMDFFELSKKEIRRREENLIKVAKGNSFEKYAQCYGEYIPALILVFLIEDSIKEELRKLLTLKIDSKEADDLLLELNVPLQNNFYKQEEYDLVTCSDLEDHVRKYNWIRARYGSEKEYTLEEARNSLKKIDKEVFLKEYNDSKEKLKNKIEHTKELLGEKAYLVDIFQYIIYYRTQRTDIMNKSAFLAVPMFKSMAKSYDISYEEFLYCSEGEIIDDEIPSKEILNSRMVDCTKSLEDGKYSMKIGEDSKKIIDFFKEEFLDIVELRGDIANKGNAKGVVRIILDKNDFYKFQKGDVLAASMTTIDMIPLMKDAAAFVTDEGGITCHAAIISRELKKPCIIGTKIATQVLKDGDLVEVDADKGVVRIIK